MQRQPAKSESKLRVFSIEMRAEERLPRLSNRATPPPVISKHKKTGSLLDSKSNLLSSPVIQRSQRNLALMQRINPVTRPDTASSNESAALIERLESGKHSKLLPQLDILKPNTDKRNYLKQPLVRESLVGEEAVQKFYERYRQLNRREDKEDFFNQKHTLTSIVSLLQLHNFTPRKLSVVKLRGEEAILDLRKLGLGQGSMGPVIAELVEYFDKFEEVNLSYNLIDAILGESLIERLGHVKIVDLSHNRIGKVGCEKFSALWMDSGTRIEELILEENNLIDIAGVQLMEHMSHYGMVRKLNVSKNFLGSRFAQKLKEFLHGNKHLQELYLSWNQFTSKGVKVIMEGVHENLHLRVFDFSWNKIGDDGAAVLARIFKQNQGLVHVDVSFCELKIKEVQLLSKALEKNHILYGLHFEGNSGYVDHKGFLRCTEKEFSEYPLPIMKGILRRINGVRPHLTTNTYKNQEVRDVCWICQSWQEKYIELTYTAELEELACKNSKLPEICIHFKHEHYNAVRMGYDNVQKKLEISRMLPRGNIQFFFSIHTGQGKYKIFDSNQFNSRFVNQRIRFNIGKLEMVEAVESCNSMEVEYEADPLSSKFDINVGSAPREKDVPVRGTQDNTGKKFTKHKRKIKKIREERVKVTFKEFDEDNEFLKDREDLDFDYDYTKKCIEFDIANSKIPRVIKKEIMEDFKSMMERHYRNFKDTFYYLARNNPNSSGIFSVTDNDFILFLEEQKYITKRVTQAKIMLKLTACLATADEAEISKGKKDQKSMRLFSRPQFMEVLIRIALEKWCTPVKKKKQKEEEDKPKPEDEWKNLKKKRRSPEKQTRKKSPEKKEVKEVQQPEEGEGDAEEEQALPGVKKILKLPLSQMEAIERIMRSLGRYADNYRSSNWRKHKYLNSDVLIVLKAYDEFLRQLYDKYSQLKFKTRKDKKLSGLLTLDELKNMILDADIKRTKEAMKEMEEAFLEAKRLEYEDGNIPYGLCFEEFQECLGRIARSVWFNPAAASDPSLWENQSHRKAAPLFLRLQSFIIALYWRTPSLHSKRMSKIAQKGIFELQISLIRRKIEQVAESSGFSLLIRMNSIMDNEISLKDITNQLREYYDTQVIQHEVESEMEEIREEDA